MDRVGAGIQKILRERRRQRNQTKMQGTEVVAKQQLERNSKAFCYPECGFAQKIEYTLLYSMLLNPKIYPAEELKSAISAENFQHYFFTNEGDVSYSQLSAILACSSEHNPASDDECEQEGCFSVSRWLCKKILTSVVNYANQHNLDREAEVEELFEPVHRVTTSRVYRKDLASTIPFYLGYVTAVLTANPIPLVVGTAGMAAAPNTYNEQRNIVQIMCETNRKAHAECTGLLDEAEDIQH